MRAAHGTASLFIFALATVACSDDTTRLPDARPDLARVEMRSEARPSEGTGDGYSGVLSMVEVTGDPSVKSAAADAGPPSDAGGTTLVTLLGVGVSFDAAHPTIKPDFIDTPTPPNCVAYKWTATTPPNRTTGDAGKVSFTGHRQAMYIDADNPGTPAKLPASLDCTRKQVGTSGLYRYDCGLPENTLLYGENAFESSTSLSVSAAGGADVKEFAVTGLAPAPVVSLKSSSTDLSKVDPAAVKIEWEQVAADLVAIDLVGWLSDKSAFTQITCTAVAASGSKTIPAQALALLPKPTATAQLLLQTSVVALKVKGGQATWGSYLLGAGRGVFGMSCRTPAGPC